MFCKQVIETGKIAKYGAAELNEDGTKEKWTKIFQSQLKTIAFWV